jgi:hypothetical protein
MTMDNSTPGSTPPPTWTPDPVPAPPVTPPQGFGPTSFAPVPLVATTTPRKNRASAGTALLLVGALVAIGGVAFAVGRVTAPAAAATTGGFGGAGRGTGTGEGGTGGFGAGGFGGAGGGRNGGGVSVTGTVVSVGTSTIQIKLSTGSTMTLNLGTNVTYRDSTTGSASDVTPGATVQIGFALGAGTGATASGNPRPSGGFGGLGSATVGTITVVKP